MTQRDEEVRGTSVVLSSEFGARPGASVGGGRALWTLAKWMVLANIATVFGAMVLFSVAVTFAPLWPLACFGATFGHETVRRTVASRNGRWLVTMPFSRRWLTPFLWSYAVLLYPALFLVIQLCAMVCTRGTLPHFPILPVTIIAAGFPALTTLGTALRPLGSEGSSGVAGIQLLAARALEKLSIFLMVLMVPMFYPINGSDYSLYLIAAIVAVALVVTSAVSANRAFGLARLAEGQRRPARYVPDKRPSRQGPLAFSPYWGLWVPQTPKGTTSLAAIVMVGLGLWFLYRHDESSQRSRDLMVLFVACGAASYASERARVDFRVLRALPVPRTQQTIVAFTPMIPTLAVVGGSGVCIQR